MWLFSMLLLKDDEDVDEELFIWTFSDGWMTFPEMLKKIA